eukprot:symbB.v1.2.028996.t1/scaffold3118.1/size63164/3
MVLRWHYRFQLFNLARRCQSTALQPEFRHSALEHESSSTYKVRVFRCAVNLNTVALSTWRRCVLGSTFGMLGTLTLATNGWLWALPGLTGVAFLCWVPSRLRQLSSPFVEEMFLHVPFNVEDTASGAAGPSEGPAVASSLAAVEASSRLLSQIQSLELELIGPTIIRRLIFEEPLKTKPLLRSAGFRSDSRCSLAELCARPSSEGGHAKAGRRGPLHIDPAEGTSCDAPLLAALLRSPKVLALEELLVREEVAWPLSSIEADISEYQLPPHLEHLVSLPATPEQEMVRLGHTALLGGLGLAVAQGFAAMQLWKEGAPETAFECFRVVTYSLGPVVEHVPVASLLSTVAGNWSS